MWEIKASVATMKGIEYYPSVTVASVDEYRFEGTAPDFVPVANGFMALGKTTGGTEGKAEVLIFAYRAR